MLLLEDVASLLSCPFVGATAVLLLVVVAVVLVEATVLLLAGAVGVGVPLAVDGTATSPVALYSEPLYDSNIDMLDAISWLVDNVIYQSLLQCTCAEHTRA